MSLTSVRSQISASYLLAASLLPLPLASAGEGAPPSEVVPPSELERVLEIGAKALASRVDPDEGMTPEDLPSSQRRPGDRQTEVKDRFADVARAIDRYRETGEAAILKRSSVEIFPFGESQPFIRCSPFVVCDIELEPGEIVTDFALGAPRLWDARPMVSGDPAHPTPHVILWPLDYNLATNAVIATSRRTYHIGLLSPPKEDVTNGQVRYHRHVAFYYPAETVRRWASMEEIRDRKAREATARRDGAIALPVAGLDLNDVGLGYRVKSDKGVTWTPDLVLDNGRQVYLHFPPGVRSTNFPTLLVQSPAGKLGVANFRVSPNGEWMIFDGLFERARLISGTGKKQRMVEIRKGT